MLEIRMMNSRRSILYIIVLFIFFIIWKIWEKNEKTLLQQHSMQKTTISSNSLLTEINSVRNKKSKKITIKTDVLELTINAYGGDIEQALLLTYLKDLKSNEPFKLLKTTPEFVYQAQSGLIGQDGPDNSINNSRPLYHTDKDTFFLSKNQNELIVPMTYIDVYGNIFIKTFLFKRNEYSVNVNFYVKNMSVKPLNLSIFGQLKQSINLPSNNDTKNNNFSFRTFRGGAYSTSRTKYKKYTFNDIKNNENINIDSKNGWVAMLQQYFVAAWVPCDKSIHNFYTRNLGNNIIAIGYKSHSVFVQPGKTNLFKSILWIGPKIQDKMADVAPYLDLTVDYGWLWFISQPMFKLLKFIYSFFGNWGFSIIAITFIVRGITYPLTKAQYISIARMRMLQPKIQAIRERLGSDKQRISQEIIEIYKKEKVNPFGGCFPLLIQMPIFLALYYMLMNSVELRHAPFILWLDDLSAQDPYYVLPIIMGMTMYLIHKMSPVTVSDQKQQNIILFMPIIFTIFFLWFPSGLVLYYIISNLVTIIQQQLIYHSLELCGLHNSK